MHNHTWAVVQAAGDGKRLAGLTTDHRGGHVPSSPRIASALSWPKRMSTGGNRWQAGNLIVQPRNLRYRQWRTACPDAHPQA